MQNDKVPARAGSAVGRYVGGSAPTLRGCRAGGRRAGRSRLSTPGIQKISHADTRFICAGYKPDQFSAIR